MKLYAYIASGRVIFITDTIPVHDPQYIGNLNISPPETNLCVPASDIKPADGMPINTELKEFIAPYKGIDYRVFVLGKHRMSFLVPDGATDVKCTYRKRD